MAQVEVAPQVESNEPHADPTYFHSVLREHRAFAPPAAFSEHAWVPSEAEYNRLYEWSVTDPAGFWNEQAKLLDWMTPPQTVLEGVGAEARWFRGGVLI